MRELEPGPQPIQGVRVELPRVETDPIGTARRGSGIRRPGRGSRDLAVETDLHPERAGHREVHAAA